MNVYTYISPGKFELIDKPKIGLQILTMGTTWQRLS